MIKINSRKTHTRQFLHALSLAANSQNAVLSKTNDFLSFSRKTNAFFSNFSSQNLLITQVALHIVESTKSVQDHACSDLFQLKVKKANKILDQLRMSTNSFTSFVINADSQLMSSMHTGIALS